MRFNFLQSLGFVIARLFRGSPTEAGIAQKDGNRQYRQTPTPEELEQRHAAFKIRKAQDDEKLRRVFEEASINGKRVVEVGDMVWWPSTERHLILAACQLEDGTYLALGYEEGGGVVVPQASQSSWVLSGLKALPILELDDDGIFVRFSNEHYLIAAYDYQYFPDTKTGVWVWRYIGRGCGGQAACRALAKRGFRLEIEQD